MLNLFHTPNAAIFRKNLIGSFATKEAALAAVRGVVSYIEEDSDNPGCFDLITATGDIYAIEPTK